MLVLASASPRRRELLGLITENFRVVVPEIEEVFPPGAAPAKGVEALARQKARAVQAALKSSGHRSGAVIGADTVVVLDGEILGKPRDQAHAAAMLAKLSGRRHTVHTGVAVVDVADQSRCDSFVESAEVEFIPLDAGMIRAYVATGEPVDKAGAYGIQGKGALLVAGIAGDYYAVMGLPVCKLAQILREKGLV